MGDVISPKPTKPGTEMTRLERRMAPLGERSAVEDLERREGVGEPLERNSGRFERRSGWRHEGR